MVFTLDNGTTPKILGIIGQPLRKSLSAKLYNAVFQKQRLPFVYLPFELEKSSLKNLLLTMRLTDVESLNVTIPFKEAVLPYLDKLDRSAKGPEAVNLILRRGGKFVGYNTDGEGWWRALQTQTGFRARNRVAVIVGAGGTARTLAYTLAKKGIRELILLNRNTARRKKLSRFLKNRFRRLVIQTGPLTKVSCRKYFPTAGLLVQATSQSLLLPGQWLHKGCVISDVVYWPYNTPLIKRAKRRKLRTCDGLWMFCHQAALNLRHWTGQKFSSKKLRCFLS